MNIKVLGGGCKRCEALLSAAKEAVRNKGITAEIEYITDMTKIMETGVMSMPALMIDDTVVSSVKVLKAKELRAKYLLLQERHPVSEEVVPNSFWDQVRW